MSTLSELRDRAIPAAKRAARIVGLRIDQVELLADGFNLLLALGPAGTVVCRIATVTAQARVEPARRMMNELRVARYLSDQGFPAARPLPGIPAEVVTVDGFHMSFWERLKIDAGVAPSAPSVGASLRDLHTVLRECPIPLCEASPAGEIPSILRSLEDVDFLTKEVYEELLDESEQLVTTLSEGDAPQVQHGDAHPGNCVVSAGVITWLDFEETCRAPVWWDLAALRDTWRLDGAAAVRGYGIEPEDERLAAWRLLRNHEWVVWNLLAARFFPAAVSEVPDAIARWRAVMSGVNRSPSPFGAVRE